MKNKVTIIVPTYREKDNIDKIQKMLQGLMGDFSVIFSDGFSDDGTFENIYFPKIQETRYRGPQMNAGARKADGDYLFFLHADSIIEDDAILEIEKSNVEVGCFSIDFGSSSLLMKIEAYFSNLRVDLRKIAFGDQGIFIKKDLFFKLGGFRKIPLMEDYQLSIDLKKAGIKIKRLEKKIISSPRRFEENGFFRQIFKMQYLQYLYRRGVDPKILAKKYK